MANRTRPDPSYCLHKSSGAAFVLLGGKPVYLGRHGSPESRQRYQFEVERWKALGRPRHVTAKERAKPIIVAQLLAMFWQFGLRHYAPPEPTDCKRPEGELGNYWEVMGPLRRLFGDLPVDEFDALKLERLRDYLTSPHEERDHETGKTRIRRGWCRNVANRQTARVRRIFAYGVKMSVVKPETYTKLRALDPIRKGFAGVRESEPVQAVSQTDIDVIMPHLPEAVQAMVQISAFSGMRANEICRMNRADLDTTPDDNGNWIFSPTQWKGAHRGHKRRIPLGKQSQQVLAPWLDQLSGDLDLLKPIFGHTVASFRRAIYRACMRAWMPAELREFQYPKGLPHAQICRLQREHGQARRAWIKKHARDTWTPGQLRHLAAERWEAQFGREAAAAMLGHRRIKTTLGYTDGNMARLADRVAREVG